MVRLPLRFLWVPLLLWIACGGGDRLSPPPPEDAGPPDLCDPEDTARLLSDPRNCGSCGTVCPGEYANGCTDGSCSCGGRPVCSVGSGCRFDTCVPSDRFETCAEDGDCEAWQECVLDSQGDLRCISQCEFDDECFPGFACIEGACSFVTCVDEECDGRDNDCDGSVDEGAPRMPLSRYCYSGPPEVLETLDPVPPCRLGVQVCEPDGVWSPCRGEVPPTEETGRLACDGRDNDCDTCPDGVWDGTACVPLQFGGYDVVFVIDNSGSMQSIIAAVKQAIREFTSVFDPTQPISFGIVALNDLEPEVFHDLSPFPPFEAALAVMPEAIGSREASWDALWSIGTGELELSWSSGRVRILALFTDEMGQSYRRSLGFPTNLTETDVCAALTHGEVLFTLTDGEHYEDFDDCGETRPLTEDVSEMTANLQDIISDPCL